VLGAIAGAAAYKAVQGFRTGYAYALLLGRIKHELSLDNASIKHFTRKNTYGNI
jgi:MFS superfamily sulfate permease-like transporter